MFGIRSGTFFICHGTLEGELVLLPMYVGFPIMKKNAYDADLLLQELTVTLGKYDLEVYEFKDYEQEDLLARRLRYGKKWMG